MRDPVIHTSVGEEIDYASSLVRMRQYFEGDSTRSYGFRKAQLQRLRASLLQHEHELYAALYTDLEKNKEEAWVTEIGFVLSEINVAIRHLRSWMKGHKVKTNLLNFPSSSYVLHEPLGVVLIIGPWNYPLQLLFTPLIGAIAAGNCAVVKPSEFAPATARVMKAILEKAFAPEYILYVEGDGAAVVPRLMSSFTFDHVFYTGSTAVGRVIYQAAARDLVPVTLELGGKSPCVVERDANLRVAARRIAVTKFSNAGQMCVAPDYILVHASVKEQLIGELVKAIRQFYSEDAFSDYNYGKIINEKQFHRLLGYLSEGRIVYGGRSDASKLYLEPTIIDGVALEASLMREEIFGPILPVCSFETRAEARGIIERNKNPLAFFLFTESRENERYWVNHIAFGGGCINNASWHLTNYYLPFGGRGESGHGRYHGKYSFETFSHKKALMKTPAWFDPAVKYPPFKGKLKLFKWLIR